MTAISSDGAEVQCATYIDAGMATGGVVDEHTAEAARRGAGGGVVES
jgi:hypothetical protein